MTAFPGHAGRVNGSVGASSSFALAAPTSGRSLRSLKSGRCRVCDFSAGTVGAPGANLLAGRRDPGRMRNVGILRLLRVPASEPGGSRTLEYRITMSRRDPLLRLAPAAAQPPHRQGSR